MSYLVCIDPGHAKNTAGKRSFDEKLREYKFNRHVAKRIVYHLERHGVKTMYSCNISSNADASLSSRCKKANDARADIYVSIHANAYGEDWNEANGWEVFYCKGSEKGKKLADHISAASIPYLGLRDRGVKVTSEFTVLVKTTMPAVLIEHAFYTNKEECALLLSNEFREKCAIADAKGVLAYFGIAWKEENENNEPHWAQEYLDYLTGQGIIENPEAWTDFDGAVSRGAVLALIAKLHKSKKIS